MIYKPKFMTRLFIKEKQIIEDPQTGQRFMKITGWKEVDEIDLGSVKNPNKNLSEIRIQQEQLEPDNKFFDGWM